MTDEELLYEQMIHPELYIIDELEKLREDMEDCYLYSTNGNSPETTFLITKDLMISLVDKRISKLKGEKE